MKTPKVVMFIDDDEEDINFYCEACGVVDHSIIRLTCKNGWEAVQMLKRPDTLIPDFIFLDIYMPVMDGKKCFVELRKMAKIRHVPIIMCSASEFAEDKEDCEKLGADFYLTKPVSVIDMINSLLFVFDRYENITPERNVQETKMMFT
jgi:CheY-like chemotaxis protein